jgi:hypothetical protein
MAGGFFERAAHHGLSAAAEALFPENGYGAPDFKTTELVARTLSYLDELPAAQRRLLLSLFALVELGAPVLVPGFCRFSRLPVARREAVVRAWRQSRLLPLRLVGDALKATTTMMYMSHPAALTFVGAYSSCARPLDPLVVSTKPDTFGCHTGTAHE